MMAVGMGHPDVVRSLLQAGANASAAAKDGSSALQAAIEGGNMDMVSMLVAAGASTSAKGNDGQTLLHAAAASRYGNGRTVSHGALPRSERVLLVGQPRAPRARLKAG